MLEDRVTELESRLAFQESTLQDLNDVIVKQQQRIDALDKALATAIEQLQSIMPSNVAPASEETPPPHY